MKKMTNIAWGVFFLLVAFSSKAAGEVQVEIQENEKLVVQLDAPGTGAVLLLQDQGGAIFYKDSLFTGEPYKVSLPLKLLPEGTYFLNVEEDFSIRSWAFDKTGEDIKLRDGRPDIVYKPQFKLTDERIRVFMSNPWGNETSLSVYDSKGEVVGSSGDKKSTFQRVLNFSGVPQGVYTIHIKSADRSFLKTIRIEPKRDLGSISMVVGKGF